MKGKIRKAVRKLETSFILIHSGVPTSTNQGMSGDPGTQGCHETDRIKIGTSTSKVDEIETK